MAAKRPEEQGEAYYRALVENSADPIALLDRDGIILFLNESILRVTGYTRDELIGTSPFDRVHPDDLLLVKRALEECAQEPGNRVSVEYRARHRSGLWHDQEVIGVNRLDDPILQGIVVNHRDITARKRAEAALIESERAYASTFDEAPIGIVHTRLDGRFLRVNRRLTELLGYSAEELLTMTIMAITHPDDVDQDVQAMVRLLEGGVNKYQREQRYRHKDGRFVFAKMTTVLLRESEGRPRYFISTIEDASDRIRLEAELRQGQKMEAVGRLAGGIAHDFNNLLTAIIGYSDLVLEQLEPGSPQHSDVEHIKFAGTSAAALTRQLLAFSRKQILQPQILDLNAIVSGMDGLLRRLIGEDVKLSTQLAGRLDRVCADPGQIQQIIMNLAINARDAMPRGGSLTVLTTNVTVDADFVARHAGAPLGRHVLVTISDTGIGMDDAIKAHLFEPFFTTKESGKGTGLGLATVYGIVKQSGGAIFVESERGRGTRFEILLPVTDLPVELAGATPPSPTSLGGTETILLVEDQAEVRGVIRQSLTRYGYTLLEAANGEQALSLLKGHAGPIDLLLTDVVMPGMSGRELAERLAARRPDVRVLYTSGYTDDAIVHHGVLEAGVDFIQKPFLPKVLLQKIREVLDRE